MDGEYIPGRGDCLAKDPSRNPATEKFSTNTGPVEHPGLRWSLKHRLWLVSRA